MELENRYYTPKQIQDARTEQGYPKTSLEHATRISRGHADVLRGVTPEQRHIELTARQIAAASLDAPELATGKPLVYIDRSTGTVLTKQEEQDLVERKL